MNRKAIHSISLKRLIPGLSQKKKPGCPIYWQKLWYFRLEEGWIFIRYHFHCILERDDDNCKTQLEAIISMIFYKCLTNTTPISVEIFIAAESILVEKAIYIHILQFRVILIKSKDVRFSYSVYLTKQHQPFWIGYIWEASSWLAFKHWIYLNLCRWTVSDIFLFLDSSEFPVTTFWK